MARKRCTFSMMRDLPGIVIDEVESANARSVSHAVLLLRADVPINGAGGNGAIVVWIDDDGDFRCEFMRHRRTIDEKTYTELAAVAQWLKDWWPKMEQ